MVRWMRTARAVGTKVTIGGTVGKGRSRKYSEEEIWRRAARITDGQPLGRVIPTARAVLIHLTIVLSSFLVMDDSQVHR